MGNTFVMLAWSFSERSTPYGCSDFTDFAGLAEVSGLGGEGNTKALMRKRKPIQAKLSLNLPFEQGAARVWDLDERDKKTHRVTRTGALLLSDGPTDHDFVIIIRPGA